MPTLTIGSPAPALDGAAFLHGNVPGFALGRGYAIDFWATWCPPCRATLPHLAQLQKRYPALTFAAISTERDPNVVRRYRESNPELQNLAVAYDPRGVAFRNWMQAAGRNGIPCTFIVNGAGRIAWIGHPAALEREVSLRKLLATELRAGALPPKTGRAMRFVGLPERWDFAGGNLIVEVTEDPMPRSPSVRTVVKIDGRDAIEPTVGAPTFALTRREFAPGRRVFEVVRRDLATGREFVTDRATVDIVGGRVDSGSSAPVGELSPAQENVLRLTNDERAKVGLPGLRANSALMRAAQDYAALMARERHFSHTGPDGSQPWDRARRAGYSSSFCGENIAMGQRSAAEALRSWMNSKGHRKNILKREYREIGVGNVGEYWVQLFGSPL